MHTTTAFHLPFAQSSLTRFAPIWIKGLRSTALAGFITLAFLSPATAADFSGSLKGMSITDAQATNKAPIASFTYTKNGDIFTFDASRSSDPDGNIASYSWDFGDGSKGSGSSATHQYTKGNYNPTLTITDNSGGIAILQQAVSFSPFSLNINFQPAASDIPSGFKVDSGLVFDSTRGYGWNSTPTLGTRDRDLIASPDQSYDTNIMPNANDVWKVAVPAGSYQVTICVGDAYFPSSTNVISIEGIQVMNANVTYENKWVTKVTTVNVTDNEMTFTFTGSPSYLQICWIKIEST